MKIRIPIKLKVKAMQNKQRKNKQKINKQKSQVTKFTEIRNVDFTHRMNLMESQTNYLMCQF